MHIMFDYWCHLMIGVIKRLLRLHFLIRDAGPFKSLSGLVKEHLILLSAITWYFSWHFKSGELTRARTVQRAHSDLSHPSTFDRHSSVCNHP
jgi:hypothetical protein